MLGRDHARGAVLLRTRRTVERLHVAGEWASAHAAAAVDVNRLPGDESAVLASEKGDCCRDFRRISQASDRDDGRALLDDVL